MKYTHRHGSKASSYLMMTIAGSVAVQFAHVIPELWTVAAIAVAVGGLYLIILLVRYWGMFTGKSWAEAIDIHSLDSGLLEFVLMIAPLLVGGVTTWLIY